jgi:hypothetical protein
MLWTDINGKYVVNIWDEGIWDLISTLWDFLVEDSLRGYQGEIREEQVVQVQQEGVGGVAARLRTASPQSAATISQRKPVVPAAISAPILRESSMNW